MLRLRRMAADVIVKRGLVRGRVWRTMNSPRATADPAGPSVIWLGEFASESTLAAYEQVADRDPEFLSIRKQMGFVTTLGAALFQRAPLVALRSGASARQAR